MVLGRKDDGTTGPAGANADTNSTSDSNVDRVIISLTV